MRHLLKISQGGKRTDALFWALILVMIAQTIVLVWGLLRGRQLEDSFRRLWDETGFHSLRVETLLRNTPFHDAYRRDVEQQFRTLGHRVEQTERGLFGIPQPGRSKVSDVIERFMMGEAILDRLDAQMRLFGDRFGRACTICTPGKPCFAYDFISELEIGEKGEVRKLVYCPNDRGRRSKWMEKRAEEQRGASEAAR